MPLVGSSTAGENWLKLSASVPADPGGTGGTPLGPGKDEPPLPPPPPPLPLQAARTPAAASAAAARATGRTFQCLVIVDTLFRCCPRTRWREGGRPVLVP